ncbi:MAG: SPOR domain-containing protein [Pseudomonadota bacterium]
MHTSHYSNWITYILLTVGCGAALFILILGSIDDPVDLASIRHQIEVAKLNAYPGPSAGKPTPQQARPSGQAPAADAAPAPAAPAGASGTTAATPAPAAPASSPVDAPAPMWTIQGIAITLDPGSTPPPATAPTPAGPPQSAGTAPEPRHTDSAADVLAQAAAATTDDVQRQEDPAGTINAASPDTQAATVATDDVQHQDASPGADTQGAWLINIASVGNRDDADHLAAAARSKDFPTALQPVTVNGKHYWRVQITGSATHEEARQTADRARTVLGLKDLWIMAR